MLRTPENRIKIAKDVIEQIKAKTLIPSGIYLYWEGMGQKYGEFSELLKGKTCEVCAIGSMFVCAVKEWDNQEYNSSSKTYFNYLAQFFSMDTLNQIEYLYMGWNIYGVNYDCESEEEIERKQTLNDKYLDFYSNNDGAERIIKIMENIIQNNGDLVHTQLIGE